EGARDRDALLLAAVKLGGKVIEPVAQADTAKQLARALAGAGFSAQLERHLHVLERRERGDELKALEDEPDFLPAEARPLILVHRRQVRVVEQHGAAAWRVESGEQAEERRLAAAGWTDHGHERALGDGERDVAQHREPVVAAAIFLG